MSRNGKQRDQFRARAARREAAKSQSTAHVDKYAAKAKGGARKSPEPSSSGHFDVYPSSGEEAVKGGRRDAD